LADGQKAACLPESMGDTNIEDVAFLYKNGKVGFPPGDGTVVFSKVLPALTDRSYFVVVLSDPIQADNVNTVSQIGLICT
jgi:hypothetical protein